MKSSRLGAYLLLIAVALIWGNAFVAIRYALEYITPVQLLIYRFIPASLLFAGILFAGRGFGLLGRLSGRERWRLVLAGLCSVPFYNFALNWGEQHITAGMASLIIALNPGITYVFCVLFQGRRTSGVKIAGLIVSFSGLCLLVVSGQQVLQGNMKTVLLGALVTLASPVSWAAYTLLGQPLVKRHSSLEVTAWATLIGTIPLLFLVRPSHFSAAASVPATFWLALAWLAVFCTVAGFVIWYWALKRLGAAEVSSFIYLIPAFAILFGRMLLNEPITLSLIVGGALILAGITLVNWQREP